MPILFQVRSVSALVTAAIVSLGGCGTSTDAGFDRRVYVGAGALVSRLDPDTEGEPERELDEDRSAGGSLALGYDLGERFSVEGHLAALGEATFSPEGDVAHRVGGLSALVYGLNGIDGRLLREGLSVFGRLGAGTARNRADEVDLERENELHLLLGGGLEYGFENGLAVRGELVSHDSDARYAQLGLLYRFGEAYGEGRRADAARTPQGLDGAAPNASAATAGDGDGAPDAGASFEGVVEGVVFESGSATLTAEAGDVLAAVAAELIEHPGVVVAIDAHTDNRGAAADNLELARRRALAVARRLASEGVEPGRLRLRAYGESRPRARNATAEGRAKNRRIELTVLER